MPNKKHLHKLITDLLSEPTHLEFTDSIHEAVDLINKKGLRPVFYEHAIPEFNQRMELTELYHDNYLVERGFSISKDFNKKGISVIEALERCMYSNTENFSDKSIITKEKDQLECVDLQTQQICLIPSEVIFGPSKIFTKCSTGWSIHSSYPKAVLNSICEIHERNVIIRNWFSNVSPICIDINLELENNFLNSLDFSINIFLYPNLLGIHTTAALIHNKKTDLYYFGSSASLNLDESIEKSKSEAILEFYFKFLLPNREGGIVKNGLNKTTGSNIKKYFFNPKKINNEQINTNHDLDIDQFIKYYNFKTIPIPLYIEKSSLVAVRSYSDVAIFPFKSEPYTNAPNDFKILFNKKLQNGFLY